jgi:hypothetical protein
VNAGVGPNGAKWMRGAVVHAQRRASSRGLLIASLPSPVFAKHFDFAHLNCNCVSGERERVYRNCAVIPCLGSKKKPHNRAHPFHFFPPSLLRFSVNFNSCVPVFQFNLTHPISGDKDQRKKDRSPTGSPARVEPVYPSAPRPSRVPVPEWKEACSHVNKIETHR